MTNILTILEDYINKILAEKLDIFIIVYSNNIFIYTENKKKIYESRLIDVKLIIEAFIIYQS